MSDAWRYSCRSRPGRPDRAWCWLAVRPEPALALLVAGLIGASPAAAAVPQVRFQAPRQSLTEALLSIASQAGVSVSVRDLGRCAAASRPVNGRMSVAQALERLLKGSGCSYRMIDPVTYVVEPARPAAPARPAPEAAVAPPAPAEADDAPAAPNLLDNLVVSTARRDALVGRTPYAVSTLPGADLMRMGAADAPGLAAQFGSLTATNLGAGRDKLFVRGLSDGVFTGRTQSTVGLYLDDVPITYTAPNPDLMLADVDHIELLRGPQGTLYGVGSIGGVLRVVTNRPDDRAIHAAASLSGALTEDGAPSATATAMLNLPVLPGQAAVRAVAYTERMGGYLDNPGLGLRDTNHTRRQGLRVAASDRISPEWTASAGLVLQSLDAGDSQYVDAGAGRTRSTAILEPHDNDFRQGSIGLEGRGGWGGLKLSAGYVVHDFDTRYDASPAVARFGAAPQTAAYDDRNHVEFLVGEAVFTSPEQHRLQWLAGLFAARAEQGSTLTLAPPSSGPALYAETRNDALHEWALFGEASYQVTRTLKLTGGARVFRADLRTRSAGPAAFAGQLEKTDVAPKLVLGWQPRGSVLLYAQASEGYRLGGFNTSGMAGQVFGAAGEAQPSRAYRPDELYNYEVGAKLALFKQRLHVQAAAFNAVWRNLQTDQFMASGLPFTANVGQAIDRGVELEADWRASRRLDLKANLLLNQPEVSHRDPTYGGRADAGLPGVPRVSLAAAANYRRPIGAGLILSASAQVEFVGHSRLGFDSASSAAMGDYLTNRASLGIEKRRWKLYAFIDNAADARADTFAFGNPFTYRQTGQATPMRPRTVGLTLSASY